jgi:hypothetical protein
MRLLNRVTLIRGILTWGGMKYLTVFTKAYALTVSRTSFMPKCQLQLYLQAPIPTAELRKQIWELVLVKEEPILCPCAFPALLQTCEQIRNEARKMFIGMNTFSIQLDQVKR